MNKALIVGRVSKEPIFASTPTGTSVMNFDVETKEKWIDKDGTEKVKVQYHKTTTWGRLAEQYRDRIKKGDLVSVEGSLYTSVSQHESGRKDYRIEIKVQTIEKLDEAIPF